MPYECLIKLLHLSKLPEDLIRVIEHLTSHWSTLLHLKREEEVIEPDMLLVKRIFQGNNLSVLLFILSIK